MDRERPPIDASSDRDWDSPWEHSLPGRIRNLLIEVLLHVHRVLQPHRAPRLVVFPCGTRRGNPASYLRAYLVGRTLRTRHGWRVTIVPPRLDLAQRQRIVALEHPDIILLQMERHPLNRPRFYPRHAVVFDIDDADFLWPHARGAIIEACRDSRAVIAGSTWVADWCRSYNADVDVIWTGGPSPRRLPAQRGGKRGNVVVWGHSRPQDYPDECEFITQIIERVARETPVEFWLFGVADRRQFESLVARLKAGNVTVRQFPPMTFRRFTRTLRRAAVGIQMLSADNEFSRGKSFGKILNYLAAGVAVVASRGADHARFFTSGVNGMLADSLEEWSSAITLLLQNPQRRRTMTELAFRDFRDRLALEVVAGEYARVFTRIREHRHDDRARKPDDGAAP